MKKIKTTELEDTVSIPLAQLIKRSLLIALPLLTVLLVGMYGVYAFQKQIHLKAIEAQQYQLMNTQEVTVNAILQSAISDLMLLSEGSALQAVVDSNRPSGMSKQRLLETLYAFTARRGVYDHIRVLDTEGMELARVNYNYGDPKIVPQSRLQSKAHRPYYQETIALDRDEIYISPLSLNMENGQIEQPPKPVIRLAKPVFDQNGQKRGIVILNLLGNVILNQLTRNAATAHSTMILPNAQETYLKTPDEEDTWGFIFDWNAFDEEKQELFDNDLKIVWSMLKEQGSGQIYTPNGLFTFDTYYPLQNHQAALGEIGDSLVPYPIDSDFHWKYIAHVSNDVLWRDLNSIRLIFGLLLILFGIITVAFSWILARNTLLKEASEAQVRMLAHALETSPAPAVISDARPHIQYVNPKFTELTGYTLADVRDKHVGDVSGLPDTMIEEIRETIANEGMWRGTYPHRKKDGLTFWELACISAIRNDRDEITHYVRVGIDITDNKVMERELLQAKEAAEAISQAKSEFLANMSHEIRTPMNGVIGMAELALDTGLTKEQRDYITTVQTSAESLLSIINDILDFSKIEAGRLELEAVDFDVRRMAEKTVDTLVARAAKKNLELLLNIRPDVPVGVVGDPHRLRQVLINLIGNAIKFTNQGEVVITVRKQKENDETVTLLFSVADTGIGIAADKIQDIFEGFLQADSSITRQFGGTGLGLSISSQLVQLMGGAMCVESEESTGSTFFFSIPLVKQPDYVPEAALPDVSALQGLQVMIIDDNATNRRILQKTLETFGCITAEAADGPQGLKQLLEATATEHRFDLVLLDLVMAPLNGLEVLQIIKQQPELAHLPVIMLTSINNVNRLTDNQNFQWSGYLTKPVKQIDLIEAMLTALGEQESQTQSMAVAGDKATIPGLDILMAEDNEINCQVAIGILSRAGHRVTIAENGRQALERLEKNSNFDLILMDIQMPGMDGLQATKIIRQDPRWQHIPIIAITAHAMKGDRERFLEAGMNDYLSKPIRTKDVTPIIERYRPTVNTTSKKRIIRRLTTETKSPALEKLMPAESRPVIKIDAPERNGRHPTVFNHALLLEEIGGDTSLLEELVTKFLHEMESQVPEIIATVSARNMKRLNHVAHTLKGAAAMMSAERIRDAAYRLEMSSHQNNWGEISAALADLKTAQAEFQHYIKARWPHLHHSLQLI
ncbi:MAG: response regulator [Anaerolineae bacterium]|nr:response regulator [Anaerolineae bacterium]